MRTYGEFEDALPIYQNCLALDLNPLETMEVQTYLASSYHYLNNLDSVRHLISRSKHFVANDSGELGLKHYYIGLYLYDVDSITKSLASLFTALSYLNKTKFKLESLRASSVIADAYQDAGNNARALTYYKRLLPLFKEIHPYDLPDLNNTIGWTFLNLKEIDSARIYFNKSIAGYQKHAPNSPFIAYPEGNLGLVYFQLDSLEKAEYFSKSALTKYRKINLTSGIAEALNNLGNICLKKGKIDLAKSLFSEANIENRDFDKTEVMNSKMGLSQVAHIEGNHKLAFQYLSEASVIKDSLFDNVKAINLLAEELDKTLNQTENKLSLLEKEKNDKVSDLRKSQFALYSILVALFILIISSLIIAFSWSQRQKAIKKQTEILSINQEIIRMISHDFRGPMTNIRSLMEMIRSNSITKDEFDEISEIMYRQTSDVSLMFETFVGWALSQSDNYRPKTEKTNWTENIEEVLSLLSPLASLKSIEINLVKDDDHVFETDRIASQLVLRNLISNAIKFSYENSSIEIVVSKNAFAIFTNVVDHGVGIEDEQVNKIFSSDVDSIKGTKKELGSGLGLTMALKFAELNGGAIKVESKIGKGTTFSYSLPIKHPSA